MHGQTDICLVTMPLSAVERPSIALGTLKAVLHRDGIDSRVLYPNLWFVEYVGLVDYNILIRSSPKEALVDWLFASVAFPDFEPDHDFYLKRLAERSPIRQPQRWASSRDWLLDLRSQIGGFVDWVASKIVALKPRIVGCTSTFQQHVASLALLRRLRELDPSIVTVIGGANCETVMGQTTHENFPWVDYVVSGEADGFVSPFFQSVLDHGREVAISDLPEGVFGPAHREIGYPTVDTGDGLPRAVTASLADLPIPDYDDYFEELQRSLYRAAILPGLPVEMSRGCWWGQKSHCTFCGLNGGGMSYRSKTPDQVLEEMDALVDRYGITKFETVDNILDMNYFDTVLPRLAESSRDLHIFFETKSNLKREQIELLARAGVRWIQPGIENLHSDILKLMRKGVGAWKNVQLLKLCKQNGIRVSWSMLTGFPGEKDAWYAEMATWLPLLSHLQPAAMVSLRFDRYSPYFFQAQQYGLKLQPSELYRYAYPLTTDQLMGQVYFFEDENRSNGGRSLLSDLFVDRPGMEATRLALVEWTDAWRNKAVPVLTLSESQEGPVITDTRSCAVSPCHRLSALHLLLLQCCDEAPTPDQLRIATAQQIRMGDHDFDTALADLIARRLVIQIDGRVLSLVLRAPVTRLPKRINFPGGYLEKEAALQPYWTLPEAASQAAE